MLFFSGVRTAEPLWALIDVYGLTRGVQLLGKMVEEEKGAELKYKAGKVGKLTRGLDPHPQGLQRPQVY